MKKLLSLYVLITPLFMRIKSLDLSHSMTMKKQLWVTDDTNFFLQGELLKSDIPTAQHISKLLLSKIREGNLVNDYLVEGIHSTTTPKQDLAIHQRVFIKLLHLHYVTIPYLKMVPIKIWCFSQWKSDIIGESQYLFEDFTSSVLIFSRIYYTKGF
jgi:hypothetical protein